MEREGLPDISSYILVNPSYDNRPRNAQLQSTRDDQLPAPEEMQQQRVTCPAHETAVLTWVQLKLHPVSLQLGFDS